MILSLIVAMDKNRVIGKDNKIPWRLPKELQYVKQTTIGHTIVLGRKNFESIGRALPKRRNLILTRDTAYQAEGCEVIHSVEDVWKLCKQEEEVFIFGGEQVYRQFLPYADKLYITKIEYEFAGDTFFPEINYSEWRELSQEKGITDVENPYDYSYYVYEKIQKVQS